jgi:hypothetical protein
MNLRRGYESVEWKERCRCRALAGVYVYRMTAGKFTATKRMLLLK